MNQLESLVNSSRVGIVLSNVRQSAIRTKVGLKAVEGPCDFGGTLSGGRSIWFDAKMQGDANRLRLTETFFAEHQRLALIDHGRSGAISGILALSTATDRLFWLPYALLDPRPASLQWTALPDIGPASKTVDWSEVERAHNWFCDRRDGPLARAIAKHGPPFRVQIDRSLPVCDVRPVEYPESVEESF